MLDVYRFILSLFVVQAHLWNDGSGPLSQHAVFSFYVLSGFLMTLILNETYGFGALGFRRFWINRALRLYPVYLIVVISTAILVHAIGHLDQLADIGLPSGAALVANLSMIGMAGFDISQHPAINFVPNAWSLSVELFCYFLLSLGAARSAPAAAVLLAAGVAITAPEIVRVTAEAQPNYGFQNHYGVLQAGLIPFALGSLAYFARHSRLLRFTPARLLVLSGIWVANAFAAEIFTYHKFVTGLYLAAAVNFALVPILFDRDREGIHPAAKLLGGLAYPIFVCHLLVGSVLYRSGAFASLDLPFFLAGLAATILVSLALHLLVEQRVERLRTLIKRHVSLSGYGIDD